MRYRELLEDINWSYPNFEEEWGEVVGDDPELSARYSKHFPNKETWLAKAKQGSVRQVTPEMQVQNTDAFYKITNTEIENDTFEFIISKNQTLKHDLPIAYASSRKGIILVRLTMKNFDEYDELDKFRRTTKRKYL